MALGYRPEYHAQVFGDPKTPHALRAVMAVFLLLTVASCDSWAESARQADEQDLDAAFATSEVTVDTAPIITGSPPTTEAAPSTTVAETTTSVAGPPETLQPARIETAPPATAAPTTVPPPTTTSTLRVVAVPPQPTTTLVASEPIGWIAVLASLSTANYTRQAAADWRLEIGLSDAELLLSDDYTTLTPGYWVLYEGPYAGKDAAVAACSRNAGTVSGCYPRQLALAG